MRASRLALTVLVLAGTSEVSGQDPQVLGRQVTLRFRASDRPEMVGELLAVHRDTIWIMDKGLVNSVPMRAIATATIPRHTVTPTLTPKKALFWGAGVGLLSGVGLAAACSSESGDGCAAVVPAGVLIGLLFGGLASLSISRTYRWKFEPPVAESLRRFARFPQGLPPGVFAPLARMPSDSAPDP